jgi:hypothetical protein
MMEMPVYAQIAREGRGKRDKGSVERKARCEDL